MTFVAISCSLSTMMDAQNLEKFSLFFDPRLLRSSPRSASACIFFLSDVSLLTVLDTMVTPILSDWEFPTAIIQHIILNSDDTCKFSRMPTHSSSPILYMPFILCWIAEQREHRGNEWAILIFFFQKIQHKLQTILIDQPQVRTNTREDRDLCIPHMTQVHWQKRKKQKYMVINL